jgi:hypothetical protein
MPKDVVHAQNVILEMSGQSSPALDQDDVEFPSDRLWRFALMTDPRSAAQGRELAPLADDVSIEVATSFIPLDEVFAFLRPAGRTSTASQPLSRMLRETHAPPLHNPVGSRLLGDNLAQPGRINDIMVIGRIDDTLAYASREGYQVLSVPEWSDNIPQSVRDLIQNRQMWNIDVNDGWVARGILEKRPFLLASEPSLRTLRNTRPLDDGRIIRELTVSYRELSQLRDAGYVQRLVDGRRFLVPAE